MSNIFLNISTPVELENKEGFFKRLLKKTNKKSLNKSLEKTSNSFFDKIKKAGFFYNLDFKY